jgi:hypothetical protein
MGRAARFVFLCILSVVAVSQSESEENPTQIDREHRAWIAGVLNTMHTIKVGMSRTDLMKLFTTDSRRPLSARTSIANAPTSRLM